MSKRLRIFFVLVVCLSGQALAIDDVVDTSFNPNLNSGVDSTAVQPDGKILIGGSFSLVDGVSRPKFARLNSNGTLDLGFKLQGGILSDAGANGVVNSTAIQPDGHILIAGRFTEIAGIPRNRIARVRANGDLDPSFNPDVDGTIHSLVIQPDGKVVIGGSFSNVSGVARRNIARINFNGSLDTGFAPTSSIATVLSIALQQDDNKLKILVGGQNQDAGGDGINSLIRLNDNGTLDTGFNQPISGFVSSIVIQSDNKIVIGGSFTLIQGVVRNHIARLNPNSTLDANFNPNVDDWVSFLAIQPDGDILIGGRFTEVGGATRNGVARVSTAGVLDSNFNPNANTDVDVRSLSIQSDGGILIGGGFTSIGGVSANYIARLTNPDDDFCMPITTSTGNVAVICL